MRTFKVEYKDPEYLKLLKSNGPNCNTRLTDDQLKITPKETVIITGTKTKEFGGGPSPDGFVMNGVVMLGSIRIQARVKDGTLTV